MTSFKPYMIESIYQWLRDNNLDASITFHTCFEGVQIPDDRRGCPGDWDHVMSLSLAKSHVSGLAFNREEGNLSMLARFSGKVHHVVIPLESVCSLSVPLAGITAPFIVEFPQARQDEKTRDRSHLRLVR